jgi:hypothetical protein
MNLTNFCFKNDFNRRPLPLPLRSYKCFHSFLTHFLDLMSLPELLHDDDNIVADDVEVMTIEVNGFNVL